MKSKTQFNKYIFDADLIQKIPENYGNFLTNIFNYYKGIKYLYSIDKYLKSIEEKDTKNNYYQNSYERTGN